MKGRALQRWVGLALISNKLKRVIIYRILSVFSEYAIVYAATGSFVIPIFTTPICIIVHTLLHYSLERIIK